jgi:hypothetical protein
VNTFALLSPWLAVVGLVGCIGTAVVVAEKRQPQIATSFYQATRGPPDEASATPRTGTLPN